MVSGEISDNCNSDGLRKESWLERVKIKLGLKPPPSLRENIEEALEETGEVNNQGKNSVFTGEERRILRNFLHFHDVRASDIMIPRPSVIAVSENVDFKTLCSLFASAEHSRLPVFAETLDDAKGMILLRDVFSRLNTIDSNAKIADINLIRPILFAPSSKSALDLLLEMQRKRVHMALIVDEYGAIDGLVSLEDLLEGIVGDIEDEHDPIKDVKIRRLEDGSFIIDAQTTLEEIENILLIRFTLYGEEPETDTIGGYVCAKVGRVPEVGEEIIGDNNIIFKVLEGDARRLRLINISFS